jgi:hypothetical protein
MNVLSRFHFTKFRLGLVLLAASAVCACVVPTELTGLDVSPNTANGVPADGAAQTSGVIPTLAGDTDNLYAVSLNAGVWQSLNGGPWAQLANSPQRAYSIAIDPTNKHHIAVGERDGDKRDPTKNASGVYESSDDGQHFTFSFDPRSLGGCQSSQAITGLAFSSGGALIAATACGVAVKPGQGQAWSFPNTAIGTNWVTAVVASQTKVWARDANGTLIVSTNDPNIWNPATAKPLPMGTSFAGAGDIFSLAAFDDYAFMSTVGEDNGAGNNFAQLLIYDVKNDRWVFQKRIFDPAENVNNDPNFGALNGTGLCGCNGHRFVRGYTFNGNNGPGRTVIFGAGQDMFMSTAQDPQTALLTWVRIAGDAFYSTAPANMNFKPQIHSDMWDVLVSSDGVTLWLSNDGGVVENHQDGTGWLKRNDGLHTHHVHMLYAAPLNTAYAYPTTDNSAWFAGFSGDWAHDSTGDSNYAVGDVGSYPLFAFVERQPGVDTLTGFDDNVPDLDVAQSPVIFGVTKAADTSFDGPLTFNFIQTLYKGEPKPASPIEAVMLAKMPLQYKDANTGALVTVIDRMGQTAAIVRNPVWVNHPDINEGKGAGWQLMADNLPAGTMGFLVAGGHANPVLYVLAGNPLDLYRWDGKLPSSWTKLAINGRGQPSQLLPGNPKGPVFVNPYVASVLYALTSAGIRYSTDSGNNWSDETALTNALTGGGVYPITGRFLPNSTNVAQASHGVALGTLSDMSFYEVDPTRVVASSPYTGVFFNKGDGVWHDLGAGLPKPFTPISSVFVFLNVAVVGMEGRSIWQIQGLNMF